MSKRPDRFLIFGIVLAVFLVGAATARAQTAPAVQQILDLSYSPEGDVTTVNIETTHTPVNYTHFQRDPYTFILEVIGADGASQPALVPVDSESLQEISLKTGEEAYGNTRFTFRKNLPCPQEVEVEGTIISVIFKNCDAPVEAVAPPVEVIQEDIPAPAPSQSPEPVNQVEPQLDQSRRALSLVGLSVNRQAAGLAVDIRGDGWLLYHDFVLDEPDRLVIDFKDVVNELPDRNFDVFHSSIVQVRTSQFQEYPERISRVVFDLESAMDYQIVTRGDSLRVLFGSVDETALGGPSTTPYGVGHGGDLLESDAPVIIGEVGRPAFSGAILPYEAAPQAAAGDYPAITGEAMDYEAKVIGGAESGYEGEPISIDFKDADIKDLLRFFSEISGLNIILDPEVRGNVTVRLTEVPWDQSLDIILKNQGYGKDLKGNVLRIAPHGKLASEEKEERRFKEEQELNVPLITITRPISYAKAGKVKGILDQVISRRGNIIVDDRTNTLVIKEIDLPEQQRAITELIKTLDQPTPQVEIEARIIETTKQFERALGIQWGFSGIASTTTGTTTDFGFPNNFRIDGDLVFDAQQGFRSELPNQGWAVNLPVPGANTAIGLQFGNILDTVQLDIALSAAENDGFARTLSAPKITTQNNNNASIESGFQIPIQTTANQTTTTRFVSASLQLNVTPQITADETIIMDINVSQNFPNFALSVLTGGNTPINTRRAATQVLVPDGATTVIGGIFQFSEDASASRVPFFGKLPVIKHLFKNYDRNTQNNELLIFITPRIKRLQR